VREENDNQRDDNDKKDNIQTSIVSLHRLSSLETETLAAEIHLLGQLRDRLSPAARYAGKVQTKYRKLNHGMESESEHTEYLFEGFPFTDRGKPLTGMLVIDKYSSVDVETEKGEAAMNGHYAGERLYLTQDRKWILAERVGAYSGINGSSSEWEATCRIVTDRSLLERYPMDVITEGLFEATNRLWEKLSPRMDALKKRSDKTNQVLAKMAQLKGMPHLRLDAEPKPPDQQKGPEKESSPVAPVNKVRMIGRS